MVICNNCGKEAGDGSFCPNCSTKVEKNPPKSFCSNCGNELAGSLFCPNCGHKTDTSENSNPSSNNNSTEDSFFDSVIKFDDGISSKLGRFFGKNKVMNDIMDKTSSIKYNHFSKDTNIDANRNYYAKVEPVFLEVYDSIDDEYVKMILLLERNLMTNSGSVLGVVVSQVYTPTKDMNHAEAVKFYENLANEIAGEINEEKKNGTFDEEEFFKKKLKKSRFNNVSALGISKSIKHYQNNKR